MAAKPPYPAPKVKPGSPKDLAFEKAAKVKPGSRRDRQFERTGK